MRILTTLLFLCFSIASFGQFSEELDKRNGFKDLKILFSQSEDCFNIKTSELQGLLNDLPASINSFLVSVGFNKEVLRLNRQSNNLSTFINKWYQYFDGFMVLKYLHYARDHYHENQAVTSEAANLAKILWPSEISKCSSAADWLSFYRQKDKPA